MRKTLPSSPLNNYFRFHTCICCSNVEFIGKKRACELTSPFNGSPFNYDILVAYLSPGSSRKLKNASNFSNFPGNYLERHDLGITENGYGKLRETGVKELGSLASFDGSYGDSAESCNNFDDVGNSQYGKRCDFDDMDEGVSSEDDEGVESEGDDENGEFRVLDSYNRNKEERRVSREIEGVEDEMRHPLVKEICRLVDLRASWTPNLEQQMRRLLRCLKPKQVCAVLKSLSDERVALKFFYWADRQWRYRHDPIVYYVMLEVLSKTKLCQGAKRILRLMARRKIVRCPEAFGYVMVSYSRAGNLRKALQILTLMQKAGIQPDLSICNTAIYVLVKGNKLEKAVRFLERMKLVGIMPNVVTYNCLIKGYCDMHRIEDALDLIEEMPFKDCPPDKVSYYTVMGFLCKDKRIDEVRKLMKKMLKDNNLLADQVTYNTIIHMLSKHGHAVEALEFLREAEDQGFCRDKVVYSAVVNSFCQGGRMNEAKELVHEMIQKGFGPDVVTYTAVIHGLCRIGDVEQAKKLLQQMYKHGCNPNTVSYTALLDGLCRSGKSSEAREMMKMSEEDLWTPNAVTYSAVMHGLRREGKLIEACEIVREMIQRGFFPTPVDINLLIQDLCREGRTEEAKKFMQDCLSKGCAVNVVNFTTLIHGFCQKDELDAALSVLDDMYLINKHPDVVTYTAVIDALAKSGRIEEAIQMANKMLHRGLIPTPVTYRSVIHRFCEHGRVGDLMKLLKKMLGRLEFKTVHNQVIEKLSSFGHLDEAYNLLGEVLRTASKKDGNTCHILIENCLKKGNPVLSYKVACRMFNRNMIPDLKLCEKVSKLLMRDGKVDEADKLMLRFVERGCISSQFQDGLT